MPILDNFNLRVGAKEVLAVYHRGQAIDTHAQVAKIISDHAEAVNAVWYDPSDLSTLFQDAAGTIPVTAVEQPVGKILDKSGRGNYATQNTAGYKPVLSARYNLLQKTEAVGASPWVLTQGGTGFLPVITQNYASAPNGTLTASRVVMDKGAGGTVSDRSSLGQIVTTVTGATYKGAMYVKATGPADVGKKIAFRHVAAQAYTIITLTAEWQFISVPEVSVAATVSLFLELRGTYGSSDNVDFLVWGTDLRLANETGIPSYQRVNTASDYDTIGFPKYLAFDGLDDFLVTGNIDFSSSDKIAVAAGVTKLSDAAAGIIAEAAAGALDNNGSVGLYGPHSVEADAYGCGVRGTVGVSTSGTGFAAPNSAVVSIIDRISTDDLRLRANGVQIGSNFADQGSGNFGNYPLYIGRRGGTSFPFNGRLYGLAICGGMDDIYKLKKIERYLAKKTGVTV